MKQQSEIPFFTGVTEMFSGEASADREPQINAFFHGNQAPDRKINQATTSSHGTSHARHRKNSQAMLGILAAKRVTKIKKSRAISLGIDKINEAASLTMTQAKRVSDENDVHRANHNLVHQVVGADGFADAVSCTLIKMMPIKVNLDQDQQKLRRRKQVFANTTQSKLK